MRRGDPNDLTEQVLWLRFSVLTEVDGERYQSRTQSKDYHHSFNGEPQATVASDTVAYGLPLNDFMDHLQ
jgi:hypothetical protein